MPNTIQIKAPAKVNLVLEVGAKDANNYHPVITVMQSLELHDLVLVSKNFSKKIVTTMECGLESNDPDYFEVPQISSAENIATKAAEKFFEEFEIRNPGLEINISKKIPAQAGMGGGSSDAAAVLKACAELFGFNIENPSTLVKLEKIGAKLGADVNFFFHTPCALMEHYGEIFVKNLKPLENEIIVRKPEVGLSTAKMYEALDAREEIPDLDISKYLTINAAKDLKLYNSFQQIAREISPEIDNTLKSLEQEFGKGKALLCGSGSACFALI